MPNTPDIGQVVLGLDVGLKCSPGHLRLRPGLLVFRGGAWAWLTCFLGWSTLGVGVWVGEGGCCNLLGQALALAVIKPRGAGVALVLGWSVAGVCRGLGGDGGRRVTAGVKRMRWYVGRPGQVVQVVGGRETRGRRGAVAGAVVADQDPGGSGRRGLVSPARRVGAVTQAAAGVGGLGGVGPVGCWANPGPGRRCRARVPDNRGGAQGPRTVGPARGLGQVTADRRAAALPPGLGAGRPATSRRGRIWRQVGPQGAAPTAQDGAVCGRPVGPGSGCALPTAAHVWVTGSGGGPNLQADGPSLPWRGEHTRQRPSDRGGPAHPGRQVCPRSLTEAVRLPTGVSRAPARGQSTLRFTNRAVPSWLGQAGYPSALHPARQPQRGNAHIREGFNGKPRDEPHRPRDLLHPPGSPGPRSRADPRPTTSSAPTAPSGTAHPTPNHHAHTHIAPHKHPGQGNRG